MINLIKSTLSSLLTYFLPLFPIPSTVANRLEKLQSDFLWGSGRDEHKFHLLNWVKFCSPIRSGWLGSRRLPLFNKTFIRKIVVVFCLRKGQPLEDCHYREVRQRSGWLENR